MGVITKYKFNNTLEDCSPQFNEGFIYTYTDEVNGIVTTRTIESDDDFTSCSFNGKTNLLSVEYLKVTDKVTNMGYMFAGCSKLASLDTSGFDTSNVDNMFGMFANCSSLTSLDLSNFDAAEDVLMDGMFNGCSSLKDIGLIYSNIDTINNISAPTALSATLAPQVTIFIDENLDTSEYTGTAPLKVYETFTTTITLSTSLKKVGDKADRLYWDDTDKCYYIEQWIDPNTNTILTTPNKIASAISLPINMKVFENETSVDILNCEPSYMKCTVPYFDIPDDYEYNEADELEYIKQSFELRYPDEDDVPEGWGFMGVTEDKLTIDYFIHNDSQISTVRFSPPSNTLIFGENDVVTVTCYAENNSWIGIGTWSGNTCTLVENTRWIKILFRNADIKSFTMNNQVYTFGSLKEDIVKEPTITSTLNKSYGLKALIDWVDGCTDEEFVEDFEKHFLKDYTLRYYCLVVLIGAVDNLGKNMMLDTADNKIFFPRFYDIDTICSYDNSGQLKFDVDIEMEQGYWNTSSSRLWTRIRELMHDDIVATYNDMRQNGISLERMMHYIYDEQIAKIPQTYYNKDYDVKYAPFTDSYIGMAHGDTYEHVKRWLTQRFRFVDTLFDYAPSYNNDVLTIRANTTEEMTIEIETYTPVYQHLSWYNGQMDKKKIDGKVAITFSGKAQAATDQEVLIYGGSNVKCIRGISSMNPNRLLIGAATKLTELDISNCPILVDVNANQANFSPHEYLTKLNISGCSQLGGNLRINNSILLQELDATGSAITGVIFPTRTRNLKSMTFSDCSSLTSIDLTGVNTSNMTSMYRMFRGCSSLTSLDLSGFDTAKVTRMDYMFAGCSKLASLDTSGFDTSNVTRMNNMFYNCSGLTSLDVSSFDTAKVTRMDGMFYNCSKLTSLDVSGFVTSYATLMNDMFNGCLGLTSLDVSGFDTKNVTMMNHMFTGCRSLTSLDLSGFDTAKVTLMDSMFYDCSSLTSLDVSGFDTTKVTSMNHMFQYCSKLKLLNANNCSIDTLTDISNKLPTRTENQPGYIGVTNSTDGLISTLSSKYWKTATGTIVAYYTANDTETIPTFDSAFVQNEVITKDNGDGTYSIVITGNGDFANCSFNGKTNLLSVEYLKVTDKVTSMSNMFSYCSNLTSLDVSGFDTSNVARMTDMFYDCSSLTTLDISDFDTSNVTGMSCMFYNCKNLTSLDVSGFDTANATNMIGMFYNCSSLTELDLSNFDTAKVTNMSSMFQKCSSLISLDVSGFVTTNVTSTDRMFNDCSSLTSLDVSGFDTAKVTLTNSMFNGCSNLTSLDVSGFVTSNVDNMYGMFSNCSKLTSLDVSGFDTSKVTGMDYMFQDCSNLTSLDVSGFDTAKVTNMYAMFAYCSKLTELDVSGFDTANVDNMSYMFNGCSNLTNLDVSGFDTANVTNMSYMFQNCSSLTDLDVSGFDTANVTTMNNMFCYCSSLTELDVSGFDTSNVTQMTYMFCYCSSLTELDVSGFDTSNVTLMNNMFYDCSSLTTLDISDFDTSNVTGMSCMFYNCKNLTSLDVSDFDTSNVTTMNSMFRYCSSLTSLDVSGFDTTNVTEMGYMFSNCSKLLTLKAPNSIPVSISVTGSILDRESLLDILDSLATVATVQTLTLGAALMAKLTEEEIATAVNKGWSVA